MITSLQRMARRGRSAATIITLFACAAVLIWQGALLWRAQQDDRLITDLAADIDRDPGRSASAQVLLARTNYLLRHDRLDDAMNLGEAPAVRREPSVRAAIYYNLANARMRSAVSMLAREQTDRAISLVSLANEEYRQALRLAPDDWNIRYNLDYGMRMVGESQRLQLEQEGELDRDPSRRQGWTDLPSLPKGLP